MNEEVELTVDLDVRKDAPSVFVPPMLLNAVVGDTVTLTLRHPAAVRRGRIERLDDHQRGRIFSGVARRSQ